MKASIRVASLTLGGAGPKTLGAMQKHGLRQDKTSQNRKAREVPPLVHGGLDLRSLYDAHVDGCRMNRGLKRPVMHALVQFPTELPINDKNEQAMLDHAIRFIDETHGGQAVFAARLDRDEEGRHTVDVFYSPKYEKTTRSRGVETWVSTSKHGKLLCEKHRAEIERRHEGHYSTGPRQVGIALQAELHAYMHRIGLKVEARIEKPNSQPDRLEPEAYGVYRDALAAARKLKEQGAAFIDRTKAKCAEMLQSAQRNADAPPEAVQAALRPVEASLVQAEARERIERERADKAERDLKTVTEKLQIAARARDDALKSQSRGVVRAQRSEPRSP